MKISKIIGYLLIIIGVLLNINNLLIKRNNTINTNNKVEYTLEKEISYREIDNTYDLVLSIPKINLKRGIYKITDKRNNIEENITIHYTSNYPNIENANTILIAHSGSGEKAFFKDLYKLDKDSLIELFYNHTKYIYKIDSFYSINKTGYAPNNKNKNKKTTTLITCDSKDKSKQIVYIGYIIDEIKY